MTDLTDVQGLLASLQAIAADLSTYIGREAEKRAAPLIAEAEANCNAAIREAQAEVQRQEDLVAELRRHHKSLHDQWEQAQDARTRIAAALGVLPHTRSWLVLATNVEGALAERDATIDRDALIAALQYPAVTGALAMLDSQGGTPADLADAILEALNA